MIDRDVVAIVGFGVFWAGNRLAGGGRVFKRFLEAVGFVLAEFEPERSHRDPIPDILSPNFQDATSRNINDERNLFF